MTEEPFVLAPWVKGLELAGLPRRAAAFGIDAVLLFFLGTPLLLLAALGAMYLQAPSAADSVVSLLSGRPMEQPNRGLAEVLMLAARRNPGAVPAHLAGPLGRGDLEAVKQLLDQRPLSFSFDLGRAGPSYWDPLEERLHLYRDVLFGPLASTLGYVAIGIAYFTLATWIGGGRTPGKWLLGIRTVLLDGSRLGLGEAFGRAGGYTASFSTLGMGLLQAIRDPNRQTLHDRIAHTVVVRQRSARRPADRAPRDRTARRREPPGNG